MLQFIRQRPAKHGLGQSSAHGSFFSNSLLFLSLLFMFRSAGAFTAPPGFDGFQFEPPYHTNNPFSEQQLDAIDEGFTLFNEETFDGNGRSCGTCHIAEKNYNVTTADIMKMTPAERNNVFAVNNLELENQEIIETLGLFNINQSFGPGSEGNVNEPAGPFRASMSISGVGFNTLNHFVCRVGQTTPGGTLCSNTNGLPLNSNIVDDGTRDIMLGWSGDGALVEMFPYLNSPLATSSECEDVVAAFAADLTNLDKALMSFTLAAVKTHFTLSQSRQPGTDFRCPTMAELSKMAIFQKWLGRRFELDISKLIFSAPVANEGLELFSSEDASCVGCHVNAGASDTQGRVKLFPVPFLPTPDFNNFKDEPLEIIGANKTSRSGTQFFEPELNAMVSAIISHEPSAPPFSPFAPFDEGDGQLRSNGEGGFNVQSIIEATRKHQFFHNNAIEGSIEDAIAHYFTDKFDNSQGGGAIKNAFRNGDLGPVVLARLGGDEAIDKIGFFLRVLSSVYAITDCERLINEMVDRIDAGLPLTMPRMHCEFALNDMNAMINDAYISPNPYRFIPFALSDIGGWLRQAEFWAVRAESMNSIFLKRYIQSNLRSIVRRLAFTRNLIVRTEELP